MAWTRKTGNKYKNHKIEVDGLVFDSQKEARRWQELKLLEAAGEISELQRQVKYTLIPAQREPDKTGKRGGVIKGKLIEREIAYIADFAYKDKDGAQIVEDVKGVATPEYILKRKMMLYFHGVQISEVR